MQLAHIEVGSDLQELTKHGSKAFPFQAYLMICRYIMQAAFPGTGTGSLNCPRWFPGRFP